MIIHIDKLGECTLQVSKKTQSIRATIVENKFVFTIPDYITTSEAVEEIKKITDKLLKFKAKTITNKSSILFKAGSTLELPYFSVHIVYHDLDSNLLFYSDKEDKLTFSFSRTTDIASVEAQKAIQRGIESICRKKAAKYIPAKVKQLADIHKFKYNTVKISSSKGRWGSCSSLGNINISLYCMMIPAHLLELVLLHELCHTLEMNHSPKFWEHLDRVTNGKSKILSQELKNYKLPW